MQDATSYAVWFSNFGYESNAGAQPTLDAAVKVARSAGFDAQIYRLTPAATAARATREGGRAGSLGGDTGATLVATYDAIMGIRRYDGATR